MTNDQQSHDHPHDPRRSLSSRIIATTLGSMAPPLAAVITLPLLAQTLGVSGRGEVAAATAPFLLATSIATIGLPEAVNYHISRNPKSARHAVRRSLLMLLASGLAAAGTVALASPLLAGGDADLASLIALCSVSIVPAILVGALRGAASGHQQWGMVARERAITAAFRLVALIGLLLLGELTVVSAALVICFSPVIGGLAYLGLRSRGRITDPVIVPYSDLLGFGGRIWIGAVSGILLARIDQTLMTPLAGVYELGLYAVAVSLSELPLIINGAVRDVTFSEDAARRNDVRLQASARISSLFTATAAAGLGLTMPLWVTPILGPGFDAAVGVTAVLLIAVVVGTPGSIAGAALSARGRPGLRSASLVVACIINVAILLLLVPLFGAVGAAVATLVGNLVSSNLNILFLRKYFAVSALGFYGFRREDIGTVRRVLTRIFDKFRRRPR